MHVIIFVLCVLIFASADRRYGWEELQLSSAAEQMLGYSSQSSVLASSFLRLGGSSQPVYISLTTISSRIGGVYRVLENIFTGPIVPDRVFLVISHDSFLADKGIPKEMVPQELIELGKKYPLSIVYTKNIGPHRKLLPVLDRFWFDDVIIITMDDEYREGDYLRTYLSQLMKYYLHSTRDAVVALRGRRVGLCHRTSQKHMMLPTHAAAEPQHLADRHLDYLPYSSWSVVPPIYSESGMLPATGLMLVLGTGVGGVLYRPRFLHEIIFDEGFRNATATADDITFRLAAMANRRKTIIGCRYGGEYDCADKLASAKSPEFILNITTSSSSTSSTSSSTHERPYRFVHLPLRKKENRLFPKDHSHDGGLAGTFNAKNRNVVVWRQGVDYLRAKNVADIEQLILEYLPREHHIIMTNEKCQP